jgi:hypothetical protein
MLRKTEENATRELMARIAEGETSQLPSNNADPIWSARQAHEPLSLKMHLAGAFGTVHARLRTTTPRLHEPTAQSPAALHAEDTNFNEALHFQTAHDTISGVGPRAQRLDPTTAHIIHFNNFEQPIGKQTSDNDIFDQSPLLTEDAFAQSFQSFLAASSPGTVEGASFFANEPGPIPDSEPGQSPSPTTVLDDHDVLKESGY